MSVVHVKISRVTKKLCMMNNRFFKTYTKGFDRNEIESENKQKYSFLFLYPSSIYFQKS